MKLWMLILFSLGACFARAERKEHTRFPLSENERIIQYVEENGERAFCWLALQKGEEEPLVFWSRQAGDVIYWYSHPGGIAGADKSGDDVFVVLSSEKLVMFFIQANLKTKQERMTVIPRGYFERKFDLMSGGDFKVEAPNRIHSFYRFNTQTGKKRLLEWREDGQPYLDGEPFYHMLSPPSRDGYSGIRVPWADSLPPPPLSALPLPQHVPPAEPVASVWSEPFMWIAGVLLLAAAGVWLYTRSAPRGRHLK